jgi:hypothetical protein
MHKGPSARVSSVLQYFVDADVENHASIYGSIGIASRAMKEHFQVSPQLCVLEIATNPASPDGDGGSSLEMEAYPILFSFLGIDARGNAKSMSECDQSLSQSPGQTQRYCTTQDLGPSRTTKCLAEMH